MRKLILLTAGLAVLAPPPLSAQADDARSLNLREWPVEWEGSTRDPYVAPDGNVWFVAQRGNYVANFDPATESFRRYEIEEGTVPHNVIVDRDGFAWYSGLGNGRIGRIDPTTGEVKVHQTGSSRVHTLKFDGRGNIWFTTGGGNNQIGRLQMSTGKVDLVTPIVGMNTRPYGIDVDAEGRAWASLFDTNVVAFVDHTLAVRLYRAKDEGSRPRRNAVTPDGMVWYADYSRGHLARIDPVTGDVREWLAPDGEQSRPYAVTADDQGRVWFSETGEQKRIVGFDPSTESFFAVIPVSGNVRNMMFHKETDMLWFGTDTNNIGRILTRNLTY